MRAIEFQRALMVSVAAAMLAAGGALHAQNAPPKPQPPSGAQPPAGQEPARPTQGGVVRRGYDIVSTDVIVRDNKGQFIADLKKGDFEVFEDGVKQDVI